MATCAGLECGLQWAVQHCSSDYSFCKASEQSARKGLAILFLEMSKMLKKQWWIFKPCPPL